MLNSYNMSHPDKCKTYEFFIRKCYNCKRYEHGADTDKWDFLHSAYLKFKDTNNISGTLEEKDYLKKLKEIKNYLDKAYKNLFIRISKYNKKEDNIDLSDIIRLLNNQISIRNFNDIEDIINVVRESLEITSKYNNILCK